MGTLSKGAREKALADLEQAEARYLVASGWTKIATMSLWRDPLNQRRSHVGRVAAYKQRQRDAKEEV